MDLRGIQGLAALVLAACAPRLGAPASRLPPIVVESAWGERVAPLDVDARDARAVCLFFVAPDCPIANVYAPEIERIAEAYAPRGVASFLVYADPHFGAAEVRRHGEEYRLDVPALLDPHGRLASFVGASMTPEAVVWSPTLGLAYRGRIDDLYADYGKRRAVASRRDLRSALDDVLAGRRPEVERTRAVGCFLPAFDATAQTDG